MRRVRLAVPLVLLAFALSHPDGPEPASTQTSPALSTLAQKPLAASQSDEARTIPGGASILFLTESGIGVVDADGIQSRIGKWSAADAFWDPWHPGRILINPITNRPPRLREYARTRDGWVLVRTWPTGYGESLQISPDGKWFAYNVIVHNRATWTIRAVSRDGSIRTIHRPQSSPVAWTPDDRLLLSDWSNEGSYLLWDPVAKTFRRLRLARGLSSKLPAGASHVSKGISDLSWSSDGQFFAGSVFWREGKRAREGVVVGSLANGVTTVVLTSQGSSVPVWSPVRPEIAVVSYGDVGEPSSLFLYDAVSDRLTPVSMDAAASHWVAWSPSGDWMLLDDAEHMRWLFVGRDGSQFIDYPWLGRYPRWGERGTYYHIIVC
jgi:hypothetical protein